MLQGHMTCAEQGSCSSLGAVPDPFDTGGGNLWALIFWGAQQQHIFPVTLLRELFVLENFCGVAPGIWDLPVIPKAVLTRSKQVHLDSSGGVAKSPGSI